MNEVVKRSSKKVWFKVPSGETLVVSKEDWNEFVKDYRWNLIHPNKTKGITTPYVVRRAYDRYGSYRSYSLNREIMTRKLGHGYSQLLSKVDHANGDYLDFTQKNLELHVPKASAA